MIIIVVIISIVIIVSRISQVRQRGHSFLLPEYKTDIH